MISLSVYICNCYTKYLYRIYVIFICSQLMGKQCMRHVHPIHVALSWKYHMPDHMSTKPPLRLPLWPIWHAVTALALLHFTINMIAWSHFKSVLEKIAQGCRLGIRRNMNEDILKYINQQKKCVNTNFYAYPEFRDISTRLHRHKCYIIYIAYVVRV